MPRWRTMIAPAGTSWPSPALTPSRWPTLSRPFLTLEPAFLCAIGYLSFFARSRVPPVLLSAGLAFGALASLAVALVDAFAPRAAGFAADLSAAFTSAFAPRFGAALVEVFSVAVSGSLSAAADRPRPRAGAFTGFSAASLAASAASASP